MEEQRRIFPDLKPPCGMEVSGGQRFRPPTVYPDNESPEDWWPDLTKPITPVLQVDDQGVHAYTENGDCTGQVNSKKAEGLKIVCNRGDVNGLYLVGVKDYEISKADITVSGTGVDDFAGIGAGIMLTEGATATLESSRIEAYGAGKTAFLNTRGSELKVINCELISHGGPLPEGYETVIGPGMLEPPPGLDIGGTARTTLTSDHARTYFYDSRITADAWGVLSTDAALGYDYLEAVNCEGHCIGDGYVVYSDGECHVFMHGGIYTSGHWFAILANMAEMTVNNVVSDSEVSSFLIHNVMGYNVEVADLHINGGQFRSKEDFMLLRSTNSYVEINGTDIIAENGILLHAIVNPDENATPVNGTVVYGNNIAMSNMRVNGDILNEDTDRTMAVSFENTAYTGAIRNCFVNWNPSSTWEATADSSVVIVGECRPGQISGGSDVVIHAWAGEGCSLKGEYLLKGGARLVVETIDHIAE